MIMEQKYTELAKRIAVDKEWLIIDALVDLGYENLPPPSIFRCARYPDGREVYSIRGVPFLEIMGLTFTFPTAVNGQSQTLAHLQYRRL